MTGGAEVKERRSPARALAGILASPAALVENPVFRRQISINLGGAKFGLVFLFVNLALIIATVSAVAAGIEDSAFLRGSSGLGALLHPVYSCVIYGCLAVLIPLRVAGLWDATRLDRSFDQVVATGVPPGRLHRGNYAQAMAYTALVLVATLPYQAFAYAVSGAGLGEIARDYAILVAYANVLALVTMAFAVAQIEFFAAPTAIALFLAAGGLAFLPVPSAIAHWTPVRYFIQTGFPWYLRGWGGAQSLFGAPVIFHLRVPDLAAMAALWLLISCSALLYLTLGPRHAFVPGLNNFGNVVLPGDRKRSRLRTLRFGLNRRVEMAFLYENRARFWAPWDWPLRISMMLLSTLAFWTLLIGFPFQTPPLLVGRGPDLVDLQAYVMVMGVIGLCIAFFAYGESRDSVHGRERIGPLLISRGVLAAIYGALALAGFLTFTYLPLAAAIGDSVAGMQAGPEVLPGSLATLRERLGIIALFALNLWLFGRFIARVTQTPRMMRICLILTAVAGILLPLVLIPFYEERILTSRELAGAVFFSPLAALLESFEPQGSPFRRILPEGGGRECYWTIMVTLCALQTVTLLLLWLRHRARTRSAVPAKAAAGAAILVAALAAARPAGAAEVGVEVIRGFNRHAYSRFEHFTVVLSRDLPAGGAPASDSQRESPVWELSIETADGDPYVLPRTVEVPPGTRTVVRCAVDNFHQYLGPYGPYQPVKLVLRSGRERKEITVPESQAADADSVSLLMVSEGGKTPSLSVSGQQWAGCEGEWLPERPEAYLGVDFVLVGPQDLGGWTAAQRRALLDFVRLGGTVVFFGGLDPKTLAAAPEWAELLQPSETPRTETREVAFRLHPLAGSRVVWTAGDGEGALPVLWLRSLGPGQVGFLSIDPLVSAAVNHLGGAEVFWKKFVTVAPASLFSEFPPLATESARKPAGGGSLLAVTLYFVVYACLLGPGMIFFFRARRRRFAVWLAASATSLVFTFGSPVLFLAMEAEPSGGRELVFTFYGDGGEGVRLSEINLHSSGRQRHRLNLLGEDLTVFGDGSSAPSLLAAASGSGPLPLDVRVMPWGSRRILTLSRERAPPPRVRGKIDLRPKNGSFRCEVEGLVPGTQAKILITADPVSLSPQGLPNAFNRFPGQEQCWHDISGWIKSTGRVQGSLPLTSPQQNQYGWGNGFIRWIRLNTNQGPRPRAFVVWPQGTSAPATVESGDLDLDPQEDRQAFAFRELEVEGLP